MNTQPMLSDPREWLTQAFAAVAKSLLVGALGIILARSPTIAMIAGKVVTRLWPGFRRS